jgi:hypothetical protein
MFTETQSPKKEIDHPFSKYLPDKDPGTFPQIHPHADIFPMISLEEMEALAEDIKTNGLKHPITVVDMIDHQTGHDITYILDGRNRWVSCIIAGVDPVLRDETESLTRSKKVSATLDLVITENLARRHLSVTEKTLIADQIAKAQRGGKQNGALTVAEAAKQLKVSATNVGRMRKLKKEAPDIYEALNRGEYKSMSAACKAAGLNGPPPERVYNVLEVDRLEVEGKKKLVIHKDKTSDVRKTGPGFVWTGPFKTRAEAEEFIKRREPAIQLEAEAYRQKVQAETQAKADQQSKENQFDEEQYETMVDLDTLNPQQLIDLSHRLGFPKNTPLPDNQEKLKSLQDVRTAKHQDAVIKMVLTADQILTICGKIQILLEYAAAATRKPLMDDRLVYWLKLMAVKFTDRLLHDRQRWLKSMLDLI